MAFDRQALQTGIVAILAKLEIEHQDLTALDGKVGDGDLGLTLLKAFRAMAEIAPNLPADLGQGLLQLGMATSKVSSSSFGTLLATGLLADAKTLKGRESADWSELSGLVRTAREAMQVRGKAALGDKTVLDVLDAIARATRDAPTGEIYGRARSAARAALEEFKGKPNKLGRARMFAEASIGRYDPGQLALVWMVEALGA